MHLAAQAVAAEHSSTAADPRQVHSLWMLGWPASVQHGVMDADSIPTCRDGIVLQCNWNADSNACSGSLAR